MKYKFLFSLLLVLVVDILGAANVTDSKTNEQKNDESATTSESGIIDDKMNLEGPVDVKGEEDSD